MERIELDAAGVPVVEDLSTRCEQARCCPLCGQWAVRVKQWATTRPRDLPVAGRLVRLRHGEHRQRRPARSDPGVQTTEPSDEVLLQLPHVRPGPSSPAADPGARSHRHVVAPRSASVGVASTTSVGCARWAASPRDGAPVVARWQGPERWPSRRQNRHDVAVTNSRCPAPPIWKGCRCTSALTWSSSHWSTTSPPGCDRWRRCRRRIGSLVSRCSWPAGAPSVGSRRAPVA